MLKTQKNVRMLRGMVWGMLAVGCVGLCSCRCADRFYPSRRDTCGYTCSEVAIPARMGSCQVAEACGCSQAPLPVSGSSCAPTTGSGSAAEPQMADQTILPDASGESSLLSPSGKTSSSKFSEGVELSEMDISVPEPSTPSESEEVAMPEEEVEAEETPEATAEEPEEIPAIEEKKTDAFPLEMDAVIGMPEPAQVPAPVAPEALPEAQETPETAPVPEEPAVTEEPTEDLPETLDLSGKPLRDFPPTTPEEGPEVPEMEESDRGIPQKEVRVGEVPAGPVQDPHLKRLSAEEVFEGSSIQLMSVETATGKSDSNVIFANGEAVAEEEKMVEPVAFQEEETYPTYMPQDEYLTNGKEAPRTIPLNTPERRAQGEKTRDNWQMDTQNQEGTYLYYNTPDGRETVQTGNAVKIYSPRFCSVRQVTDLSIGQQVVKTGDIANPLHVEYQQRNTGADSAKQQIQATQEAGKAVITQVGTQASAGELQHEMGVKTASDSVGVQERHSGVGVIEVGGKDTAWIADGMERANTWTQREDLRVFIDKTSATEAVKSVSAPSLYVVKEGEKKHEVKVYKVASTDSANPGEFVDFTIFFENAGDLPVGNIVLVDNLPARLEVLEDSAESSVDATFSYEPNKAGSLTLRWEITQPLSPGEKGAVKFRCKVR